MVGVDMNADDARSQTSRRLLQLGMLLFLLGLMTGFAIPTLNIPRLGVSSHLTGIPNGIFLVVLGLIWARLRLSRPLCSITFWLAIYGTFANWVGTFLAALWGAGEFLPIAGAGSEGTQIQEAVVAFLLTSISIVMVLVALLVLWGLRGSDQSSS